MTNREVMQMALDALVSPPEDAKLWEAVTALREALAQLEPEPAFWKSPQYDVITRDRLYMEWIPLYLVPPAPKVPKGWKLVPVAPTKAMFESARDCPGTAHEWAAMLAAAPEYKEAPCPSNS